MNDDQLQDEALNNPPEDGLDIAAPADLLAAAAGDDDPLEELFAELLSEATPESEKFPGQMEAGPAAYFSEELEAEEPAGLEVLAEAGVAEAHTAADGVTAGIMAEITEVLELEEVAAAGLSAEAELAYQFEETLQVGEAPAPEVVTEALVVEAESEDAAVSHAGPGLVELEAAASVAEGIDEPLDLDLFEGGFEEAAEASPAMAVTLEPEAGLEEVEEPVSFDAELMLQELLAVEDEAKQIDDYLPEPVPHVEALPSQREIRPEPSSPPLEDLIQGIDRQLESSAPAPAAIEQPAITHKQFSQLDDYVVFSLSGGDYALPVRDVAEIGRVPSVTKVPNVPEFVRGITNLRGEIVPVLNLRQLLGLQETALTARGRVLFLQARDQVAASGLLVDEVKGIQRIPSQQLEHVTGLVDDKVTSVLRGVHGRGDRLLNVLDLEQVFRLEDFQKFDRR